MANSLLIPVSVSAKVIKRATTVPVLAGGAPFNRGATLEAGIHVHWALPDALTRTKMITKKGGDRALFPGVPDLWLVVRFNPGPESIVPGIQRSWRAWVVDSQAESVTPLDAWTPPTNRDADSIHTLAGMLPSAKKIGHPGWGIFKSDQTSFDPAVAAYYPAARRRFGFYDDLGDLRGASGNVSYTVVGWYSLHAHDPLFNAPNRRALLEHWKVAHHERASGFTELSALVKLDADADAEPAWKAAKIQLSESANPAPAELAAFKHAAERAGSAAARQQNLQAMQASFPPAKKGGASAPLQTIAKAIVHDLGPKETLCHGSVVEVPLAGATTVPAAITNDDVQLFPSIKRALAEIAGKQTGEEESDYVEMLLQDVGNLKGTLGGVLDYAGAVHALSFQSVPGKSRYYARLDIHPKTLLTGLSAHFDIGLSPANQGRVSSGHWPTLITRAAAISEPPGLDSTPSAVVFEPPPPTPQEPTPAEIAIWVGKFNTAFDAAKTAALAKGTPIDERLVQVHDYRSNAQPAKLGSSTDGHGPAQASWWLDLADPNALAEFYHSAFGAKVHLPDADSLYELPGPRWYRPWAPALLLYGTGRSYRAGFDGRFRADGFLQTRMGGETARALSVGAMPPVAGRQIIEKGGAFSATPGLPAETAALLEEALLLDTESATVMAAAAGAGARGAAEQYRSAVRGMWLSRDPRLTATERDALKSVLPIGDLMSPVGISPWHDPVDPLFVDVNYAHPHSSITPDWKLEPDFVELTPNYPTSPNPATNPPAGQVQVFDERAYVTATVPKVLESALVTKITLDAKGHPVKALAPPPGIDADTFKKMDVLSAPLTRFDGMLFDAGFRQRAGALRINRLDLIDTFGLHRTWNSGIADPASPAGGPNLKWWTELSPRLPHWGRLRFRLQSAADPEQEASPIDPAIVGLLLPDFVEHALEVFDGAGKAIGQLNSDPPRFGSTEVTTLAVRFEVHPWVAAELGLGPGGDPLDAIAHPRLRELVAAILAQSLDVPANEPGAGLYETGLTALLRVVDTVRGTLDPSVKSHDRKVHLLGEPIVVLLARLTLEGTPTTNPSALAQDPPPLAAPPALPTVPVRIGDVTRPDDAVLGVFIPGQNPADARFAPVSKEAAEHAILNSLVQPGPSAAFGGVAVEHPFIKDQVSEFQMQVAEQRDLVILADVRGGLYATCGALPRKKIIIPREFLEAALSHLEPTFSTGPLMTTRTGGALKAMVPPPNIEGLETIFVHEEPGENGAPDQFPETPVAPVPPLAELPVERVLLTEGWLRLQPEKTQ